MAKPVPDIMIRLRNSASLESASRQPQRCWANIVQMLMMGRITLFTGRHC